MTEKSLTQKRTITLGAAIVAVVLSFVAGAYFAAGFRNPPALDLGVSGAKAAPETEPNRTGTPPADSVELQESQMKSVKVETAGEREFPIEKGGAGSIALNEELGRREFTPFM